VTPLARGAAGIRHSVLFFGIFPDLPLKFDRILTESVNKLTKSSKIVKIGSLPAGWVRERGERFERIEPLET
jgi:hypothetical protein